MKLLIIYAIFVFVLAAEAHSIVRRKEIAGASNHNGIETTTEIIKSTTEKDEMTSEEVEEIVSKLQVLIIEIKDDVLQKCIENGNTSALRKAKDADENLNVCFSPVNDPLIEIVEQDEQFGAGSMKKMSEHFCRVYPTIREKCLNEYYDSIRPCLSPSDLKGILMYINILNAAAKHLCKYSVEFLIEAAENEFGCSIAKHSIGFAFCLLPPLQEVGRTSKTPLTVPRFLTGKGCQLFKEMTQCIRKQLSTCHNSRYSDVIVGLFDASADTLPECPTPRTEWEEHVGQVLENLYKEEKSQTSLLKLVKLQLDQLIASNANQVKYFEEDKNERKKERDVLNTILKVVSDKANNLI